MKWYNGVMFILTVTCVSIVLLALTGCAGVGQQQYEIDKIDSAYSSKLHDMKRGNDRNKTLLETVKERSYTEEILRCENYMKKINQGTLKEELVFDSDSCKMEKVQRVMPTSIEMPKEWMDQWPSLREDKQVDQ